MVTMSTYSPPCEQWLCTVLLILKFPGMEVQPQKYRKNRRSYNGYNKAEYPPTDFDKAGSFRWGLVIRIIMRVHPAILGLGIRKDRWWLRLAYQEKGPHQSLVFIEFLASCRQTRSASIRTIDQFDQLDCGTGPPEPSHIILDICQWVGCFGVAYPSWQLVCFTIWRGIE